MKPILHHLFHLGVREGENVFNYLASLKRWNRKNKPPKETILERADNFLSLQFFVSCCPRDFKLG